MSILQMLGFIKKSPQTSSMAARDRLRIIVESNTKSTIHRELHAIQKKIFSVLAEHLNIPEKDFSMQLDEHEGKTMLELSVQIPASSPADG
ncbi:MAG: cell division topological specificity factor MinE [Pseudomonadota bacterium]|nr:cell division topological specificity factor MinE [Pseudomonadota bacterium]